MMFVCYSVVFVLLGLAHQWPEQCLLIVMAVLARRLLR
jgi:hypothetical protein